MNRSSPKVSIVIPTYNRAHYLPEALESALSQTYPNLEIIVVNDGSTDNTEEVLAPYMKRIRYICRKNGGCAAAKNTGLAASTGDFITNLDDDDRIHPQKIERQVEMFQKRPNLGICGTGVNFIDADGRITRSYIPPRFTPKTQVLQLLRRCLLVQPSVMIRREVHNRLGDYKDMLSEDYEFWLRAALHYEVGVVEDYLTDYRQHGNQITGPQTRPELMAAVAQLIQDFIAHTPMAQIIPGLTSEQEGYALIGLLLCEQKLFSLAQIYFERVLPTPAGYFGLGLLKLHERKFTEATVHLHQVRGFDSPFAPKVDEALLIIERIKNITEKLEKTDLPPIAVNMNPDVVKLRKDHSRFNATIIKLLLRLATTPVFVPRSFRGTRNRSPQVSIQSNLRSENSASSGIV